MSVFKTPLSRRIQATTGVLLSFQLVTSATIILTDKVTLWSSRGETIITGVGENKHLGLGHLGDPWISILFSWDGGSCCLDSLSAIGCWSGGARMEWLRRGLRAPPLNHTQNRPCSSQTVSIPEGQGTLKATTALTMSTTVSYGDPSCNLTIFQHILWL